MTITAAEATKAFLDALAVGESDPVAKREGISPYFILYGGGSFEKLPRTTSCAASASDCWAVGSD